MPVDALPQDGEIGADAIHVERLGRCNVCHMRSSGSD
jgi:hypothetical protein